MLISEAIIKLEGLKAKHGDRPIHLEVGETEECKECGEPKYINMCGMCKGIDSINIHKIGICAYFLADRG